MALLIAGLVLFMAAHVFAAFRARPAPAGRVAGLAEGPYKLVFTLAAIAGLALIVYGFGQARPAPVLYAAPVWARHLNLLLMAIAMIVLAAAYAPKGYIAAWSTHPMVLAVKIWAAGHLLANGELNSVILFGAFLAYGVISRIAAKRRGDTGRAGPPSVMGDAISVTVGLAAYAAIAFYFHPILFGVAVVP